MHQEYYPTIGEIVLFNKLDVFEYSGDSVMDYWNDGDDLEVLAIKLNNDNSGSIPIVWHYKTATGCGINPCLIKQKPKT